MPATQENTGAGRLVASRTSTGLSASLEAAAIDDPAAFNWRCVVSFGHKPASADLIHPNSVNKNRPASQQDVTMSTEGAALGSHLQNRNPAYPAPDSAQPAYRLLSPPNNDCKPRSMPKERNKLPAPGMFIQFLSRPWLAARLLLTAAPSLSVSLSLLTLCILALFGNIFFLALVCLSPPACLPAIFRPLDCSRDMPTLHFAYRRGSPTLASALQTAGHDLLVILLD